MRTIFLFLILVTLCSCEKDEQDSDKLIVGCGIITIDSVKFTLKENTHNLDTIIMDTFVFSLNTELESNLTFMILQDFISYTDKPIVLSDQQINIIPSEEIQLLSDWVFQDNFPVVKSFKCGDVFSKTQEWKRKDNYLYTLLQRNVRIAPRPSEDYIPFLYGSKLGWVKIKMSTDNDWRIQKIEVSEHYTEQ